MPADNLTLELRWRDPATGRDALIAVDFLNLRDLPQAGAWIEKRAAGEVPVKLGGARNVG